MSKLLAVISPAKRMDVNTHYPALDCSSPRFLKEASQLVKQLKKLKVDEMSQLLSTNAKLTSETINHLNVWKTPFNHATAFPTMLLFQGDVYRGLDAKSMNTDDLEYADQHLRILSGLYGILRPLDLIMPYRLMMGTAFSPDKKFNNLYDFWSKNITDALQDNLDPDGCLVDLASQEYAKTILPDRLHRKVVRCEFFEVKNGKPIQVSTYAKLARGKMARYIIDQRIQDAVALQSFHADGYLFNKKMSGESLYCFTRKEV